MPADDPVARAKAVHQRRVEIRKELEAEGVSGWRLTLAGIFSQVAAKLTERAIEDAERREQGR